MAPLTILIIGSGGREHALAWKLSQSTLVDKIFVCPGNGGTSLESKTTNIDLFPSDFPALVRFAVEHEVGAQSTAAKSLNETGCSARSPSYSRVQNNRW